MQSSAGQHEVQSGRDEQPEAVLGRANHSKPGTALGAGQYGCQPRLLPQTILCSCTNLMSPTRGGQKGIQAEAIMHIAMPATSLAIDSANYPRLTWHAWGPPIAPKESCDICDVCGGMPSSPATSALAVRHMRPPCQGLRRLISLARPAAIADRLRGWQQ